MSLPQREHCETAIFGPKYSFAVIDEESLKQDFPKYIKNLGLDIFTFDQSACSSPHVLFIESKGGNFDVSFFFQAAKEIWGGLSSRYPKRNLSPSSLSMVLNKRSEYYLNPEYDIVNSEELDWTILYDGHFRLEEPIGSRTLFVKVIDDVMRLPDLITRKVQTVGAVISDTNKLELFSGHLASKGVARIVPFGQMNDYDNPWDGVMLMSRLVRYTKVIKND